VTAATPRAGMTLVEVIVAMMILVGVLLTLGGFMAKFAQASGQARLAITANELAVQRLDAVRTQPTYSAIGLLAGTTPTKADFTTYQVKTSVKHIGGAPTDSVDYNLVTVTVTHPSLRMPVSKTTAVAAF
jgi:prepilin-type N-terminal cleavage/methylation domain-containing protein